MELQEVVEKMGAAFRTPPDYGRWIEGIWTLPETGEPSSPILYDGMLDKIIGMPNWHPDDSTSPEWREFPKDEKDAVWDRIHQMDEDQKFKALNEAWQFVTMQTPAFMVDRATTRLLSAAYKEYPRWCEYWMQKIKERED